MIEFSAAVIAALADRKATRDGERKANQRPTPLERIEGKTQVHARIHQGIDLRVTVFAVMIITIAAQAIKDGRTLFPQWLMIAIACSSFLGLICVAVAAFISLRNIGHIQTLEEIKDEAESTNPMDVAAVQLQAMQLITFRKSVWADFTLIVMLIDAGFFCAGISFF